MSTFGRVFKITTCGESHGGGMGLIVEGVPPGIPLDGDRDVYPALKRRRPGQKVAGHHPPTSTNHHLPEGEEEATVCITTSRSEEDRPEIYCGTEHAVTLGTPIGVIIRNKDQRPQDYGFQTSTEQEASASDVQGKELPTSGATTTGGGGFVPRPSHADYTYRMKYNGFTASSGGGRASARETASRVAAGAIAAKVLRCLAPNLKIVAWVSQIGPTLKLASPSSTAPGSPRAPSSPVSTSFLTGLTPEIVDTFSCRFPDENLNAEAQQLLLDLKAKGDSVGGIVSCKVQGCPIGLGEPCFDKLPALLSHAMMSIPATKGFEFGSGFDCGSMFGSAHNDMFQPSSSSPGDRNVATGSGAAPLSLRTSTNNSGGSQGGISNGEDIDFRVAFKPPATIAMAQQTCNLQGEIVELAASGRHDPSVVVRAVPVVEAMAYCVLLDTLLLQRQRSNTIFCLPPTSSPGSTSEEGAVSSQPTQLLKNFPERF